MQFQWDSGFTNKLLLLQNPNRTKSFKIGQSIASSGMDTIPSWEVRKVLRKGTGQDRILFLAQEKNATNCLKKRYTLSMLRLEKTALTSGRK